MRADKGRHNAQSGKADFRFGEGGWLIRLRAASVVAPAARRKNVSS